MRLITALGRRDVRLLWVGQVLSNIGDEIYSIALIWYAASLIGLKVGYLSAIQAASAFAVSVIGGVWADHRDARRIMITVDWARGGVVLLIPILAIFQPPTLWTLIPVAIIVASLSALFDPALVSILPQLVQDREILQASTGLMETTRRLARIVGPGLIGLLSRFIPLIHYFSIDALSFFASAVSVTRLKNASPAGSEPPPQKSTFAESLQAGFRLARKYPLINYCFYSRAVTAAAWNFIMPLGITLLLRKRVPNDVGALGYMVAAYGVGNLSSNLIVASLSVSRPAKLLFSGRMLAGIGFIGLALSPSVHSMMMFSAIAAAGGPITDLGYLNMIQRVFRSREIMRVERAKWVLTYALMLGSLLLSPILFETFSLEPVLVACATVIFLMGFIGLFLPSARDLDTKSD